MKVGRPIKMTLEVLGKLEEAILQGLSDEEACLYAGINPSTLYDYCNKNINYPSRKAYLKSNPKMLAKINIFKEIKSGDVSTSKWYLERKDREFNSKQPEDLEEENRRNEGMKRLATAIEAVLTNPNEEIPDNGRSQNVTSIKP